MDIRVSKDGKILVTKEAKLSGDARNKLLRMIVTKDGYYSGEDAHDRWTALYNAYDMEYGTDIRASHEIYNDSFGKVSRIEYLARTNQINKLIYVVAKLYKNQFEQFIEDFV